jgi:hypothetical protein
MTQLARIAREATEFSERTGNAETRYALNEVLGHLMGQSADAKPLTVLLAPKERIR